MLVPRHLPRLAAIVALWTWVVPSVASAQSDVDLIEIVGRGASVSFSAVSGGVRTDVLIIVEEDAASTESPRPYVMGAYLSKFDANGNLVLQMTGTSTDVSGLTIADDLSTLCLTGDVTVLDVVSSEVPIAYQVGVQLDCATSGEPTPLGSSVANDASNARKPRPGPVFVKRREGGGQFSEGSDDRLRRREEAAVGAWSPAGRVVISRGSETQLDVMLPSAGVTDLNGTIWNGKHARRSRRRLHQSGATAGQSSLSAAAAASGYWTGYWTWKWDGKKWIAKWTWVWRSTSGSFSVS